MTYDEYVKYGPGLLDAPALTPSLIVPQGLDQTVRRVIAGEMQQDYEAAVRRAVAQGFEEPSALAQFNRGGGIPTLAVVAGAGLLLVLLLKGGR